MGSQGPRVTWGWETTADQGSLGLESVVMQGFRAGEATAVELLTMQLLFLPLSCLRSSAWSCKAGERNLPLPLLPGSLQCFPCVIQRDLLLQPPGPLPQGELASGQWPR